MANLEKVREKNVTITLTDGKEYRLRFTLNALAELEDRYGSVEAAFEQLDKGSFKAIRCLLWAGVLHEHPDMTETENGNLMDIESMQDLVEGITQAVETQLPEEDATNPN